MEEGRNALKAEFFFDAAPMGFDRFPIQIEAMGDIVRGRAFAEHEQHRKFALGEAFEGMATVARGATGDFVEEAGGGGLAEVGLLAKHAADALK